MKTATAILNLYFALHCLCGIAPTDGKVQAFGTTNGPQNVAVYAGGGSVTLTCSSDVSSGQRIAWTEYATNPNGVQISDNESVLPGHPNAARYRIVHDSATQYDLVIEGVILRDGGTYRCEDLNAAPTDSVQAELTVLESVPNCNSTIGSNGIVMEDQLHFVECSVNFQGNIPPGMSWTGPPPYDASKTVSETSIWSGVEFFVVRNQNGSFFQCVTNFTQGTPSEPPPPGAATNVPDLRYVYTSASLLVSWSPKNMYYEPVKTYYDVGDTITCYADAYPLPSYRWQNMLTLEVISGQAFEVTEDYVGITTTMRCLATNEINGFDFANVIFVNVAVLGPTTEMATTEMATTEDPSTTTTSSPSTLSTTTPPGDGSSSTQPGGGSSATPPDGSLTSDSGDVSDEPTRQPIVPCGELTGRWQSERPSATLCLEVIDHNSGEIRGQMRVGGETTSFVDIVGRATPVTYDLVGWSGLWPQDIFVSSYAGECHSCEGGEELVATPISRSIRISTGCAEPGPVRNGTEFRFYRTAGSCSGVKLGESSKPRHVSHRYKFGIQM